MLKKNLEYYMSLPYTITIKKGTGYGEEYWVARVIELPHCITTGSTPEEALTDIEDAKKEWIESNLEDSLPVPEPFTYTGQYHLRMPPSLHEALTLKSESEDVSLNQYMVMALARAVGYPKPATKERKGSLKRESLAVKETKRRYKLK